MCSCTLWNANPQVVHSTELVLLEKKNGAHVIQGCNGEPLTTHGQQIVRRDVACTVLLVRQCTLAFDYIGRKTQ